MLVNKFILRAAGAGLAAIVSLAAQPLKAQASSDADRLRNSSALSRHCNNAMPSWNPRSPDSRRQRNAFAAQPAPEGKMKTVSTTDGKKYVEKLVPDWGAEKWKLFPALTELELYGDLRLRYDYRGGRLPK